MKLLEGQQYVSSVKPSSILLEPSNLAQIEEQLASWAVLKAEEKFVL
jgi:hypothetical protein